MKKRKELNALIGLGPGDGRGRSRRSRRAWKGAAGHRLLRTEPPASGSASSSEDEDEDDEDEDERGAGGGGGGSARARFARGDYFRCCKVCYPLCAFVILAACVVACVGLVWMQVALKEDLDALKDQFRSLESNQKSSFQEIPKLNEELLRKQKQLEKIESGDLGLSKVWINITEMAKQIASLTSTVNHLKANIKSASDLISLPATVEGLQKSVASIGSTLNSVRLAVEAVQKTVDEHKKTIETLQSDLIQHLSKESGTVTPSPSAAPDLGRKNLRESLQQDVLHLQSSLEEVSSTLVGYQRQNDLKLLGMDGTVRNLTQRVSSVESGLAALNKLGKRDNLSFTMMTDGASSLKRDSHRTDGEQAQILKKEESSVSKLREKLQLITALTSKPEASKEEKKQSAASEPAMFSRISSRSLGNQVEAAKHLKPVIIPEISSLADLLDLFQRTGQGPEGKLSYQDLWNLLGSALPPAQSLAEFDVDRDGTYSFPELRLALGIEHMEQN